MRSKPFFAVATCLISVNLLASALTLMFPSGFWAVVAFLCFITFSVVLFKWRPASFVLLSPLLFLRATEMVSGIAIEYGAYIEELSTTGFATGGFARLSALYIFLFSAASIITERAWQRCRQDFLTLPERLAHVFGFRLLIAVIVMMLAYIVSIGLQNGFPLIEGIDRFGYRLNLQSRAYVSIFGTFFILAVLLGFFAIDQRRRLTAVAAIISIFVVSILFSEKFTSLSMMTILFLIPPALLRIARQGKLPPKILINFPLGIALLTMPLVLIVYGFGENPALALQKLANRMAAQGELWWIADRDHLQLFQLRADPIVADIKTWMVPSAQNSIEVGTKFGLYYVMQPYAPGEIAYAAGQQGTGYIFSLFAYLMMTTGVAGVVVIGLLTHILYACIMSWLLRAMADGDWLRAAVAMKLFIFVVSAGFIVGYLWSFFGIKSIFLILVLFGLQKVRLPVLSNGRPERVQNV